MAPAALAGHPIMSRIAHGHKEVVEGLRRRRLSGRNVRFLCKQLLRWFWAFSRVSAVTPGDCPIREMCKKCCSKEVTGMASVAAATRQTYVDRESLNHALTSDLVGWTVSETREAPLLTHVAPHRLGDIRLLELSGIRLERYAGTRRYRGTATPIWVSYIKDLARLCVG